MMPQTDRIQFVQMLKHGFLLKHIPQDTSHEKDDEPDTPSSSSASSSSSSSGCSDVANDICVAGDVDVACDPDVAPVDQSIPQPPLPPPNFPPPDDLPPPPEPYGGIGPRAVQMRGASSRSHAYYFTAHGKVTFYPGSGMYEAKCSFPGHGDCRVSKTCKPAKGINLLKNPHQGRQAVCLVAWLELASSDQASSLEHRALMPDFESRRTVRTRLKNGSENANALLRAERPKFTTEADSEPSDFAPFDDR